MLWAVLLTSAFGAGDEWHQSFTPGRRAAIDDWAMDTASAALALYVWSRLASTPWRTYVRPLAPLAVGVAFVLGIGLAVPRGGALPTGMDRTTLHAMTADVAQGALELARSTRNVARQVRSTIAG
jgi:hypothetical protein